MHLLQRCRCGNRLYFCTLALSRAAYAPQQLAGLQAFASERHVALQLRSSNRMYGRLHVAVSHRHETQLADTCGSTSSKRFSGAEGGSLGSHLTSSRNAVPRPCERRGAVHSTCIERKLADCLATLTGTPMSHGCKRYARKQRAST